MKGLNKVFIDELWDGTKIYQIDGDFVRNHVDINFIGGGNGYAYDYCPKDELWYENMPNQDDCRYILLHEIVEYIFMRYKDLSYHPAHDMANSVESIVRHIGLKKGSFKKNPFRMKKIKKETSPEGA